MTSSSPQSCSALPSAGTSVVGPRVDEQRAVKVFEELSFIAVVEQPGVCVDARVAVEQIERGPAAVALLDRERGEAVG